MNDIVLKKTVNLWPTNIIFLELDNCDGMNKELHFIIKALYSQQQSLETTNKHCWKSKTNIFQLENKSVSKLKSSVLHCIEYLEDLYSINNSKRYAEAWAVVYEKGGYQSPHIHQGSSWSGVYYVSSDLKNGKGGELIFSDPRLSKIGKDEKRNQNVHSILPKTGMLIVFPSWLYHWVKPLKEPQERICIPFNVGYL